MNHKKLTICITYLLLFASFVFVSAQELGNTSDKLSTRVEILSSNRSNTFIERNNFLKMGMINDNIDTLNYVFEGPFFTFKEQYRTYYEATKLVPSKTNKFKLITLLYDFWNNVSNENSKKIEIYIWEDNNGKPGSILFSKDTTLALAANWWGWIPVDISNQNLYINGNFWIGHREKTNGLPTSLADSVVTPGANFYSSDGITWKEDDWDFLHKVVVLYNTPPPLAINPNPATGTKNKQISVTLSWESDTDADGDPLYFDILFGTNYPPKTIISSKQTEKYFDVTNLNFDQNYYWRVISWDEPGDSVHSQIWKFSTTVESFNDISTQLTGGSTQNAYRMISVPGALDNTSSQILEQFFGTYDKTKWRFYQDKNNLREYPNTDGLLPGYAFWMISKESKTIYFGSGKYVTMLEDYSIPVVSGWNQIGNPFNQTINWNSIKAANPGAQIQGPYFYNGGYNELRTDFQPFEGCYIYVTNVQTLKIPGKTSSFAKLSKSTNFFDRADWYVQIFAKCQNARDYINYLGMSKNSNDHFDDFDYLEPPVIGDYVSLFFPHSQWVDGAGNYTSDFHPSNNNGGKWDFEVITSINEEKLFLQFDLLLLPADWDAQLFDKKNNHFIDLRQKSEYVFKSNGKKEKREFTLLLGKDGFVSNNKIEIYSPPVSFKLYQNYPNPFNNVTTIKYDIANPTHVKLVIFDLQGRIVDILFDGLQESGRYNVQWNAERLSSGIYFVQMQAGSFIKVRKVALMK